MSQSNKLTKLEKILGQDTLRDLDAASKEDLKASIVHAEKAMQQAKDELEQNVKYQELKESLKVLSQGLKDVRKRQKAVIEYSLNLLESKE